jgi:DNA mismatch endonuclease (patch repair protein)
MPRAAATKKMNRWVIQTWNSPVRIVRSNWSRNRCLVFRGGGNCSAVSQKSDVNSISSRIEPMTDVFSQAKRSWVMSRIRGKHTGPEKAVRSFLHRAGLRFRLHVRELPGCPDIVLPKYKAVIFVHGCFWHHHARCNQAVYPKKRRDFWRAKIDGAVQRDRKAVRLLHRSGWNVITVWECQIERNPNCLPRLIGSLRASG